MSKCQCSQMTAYFTIVETIGLIFILFIMQSDLDHFVKWASNNRLRLNDSKTQSMIVGSRSKLLKLENPIHFTIREKNIKHVKQYNYLGIALDNELSLMPLYKI